MAISAARPLPDRAAAQLGDPPFGHDLVDRVLERGDDVAGGELGDDLARSCRPSPSSAARRSPGRRRSTSRRGRSRPGLRSRSSRCRCTVSDAHWPSRSTAIVELIETKFASWAMTRGIVHVAHRPQLERCVLVEEVVQPLVPSANVPTVLVRLSCLATPVTTPRSTRSITPSEISSVCTPRSLVTRAGRQDRVRDRSDAGLHRGAVGDPLGDERGDAAIDVGAAGSAAPRRAGGRLRTSRRPG